ncbi:MAG: hypothetical protein HY764_00900 [Candidatus Portnoybacteria bacterium]|nr:hypothetical protein [Candidatus Portnoybacteria bacterium]
MPENKKLQELQEELRKKGVEVTIVQLGSFDPETAARIEEVEIILKKIFKDGEEYRRTSKKLWGGNPLPGKTWFKD